MEQENQAVDSGILEEAAELYEQFLDSRYIREKREILQKLKVKGYLTDKMISDFAVTLDIAISGEDPEERFYDLLRCMDSMARFETTGLR